MTKCTFCGKDERPHKGIHVIKNSGNIHYFCSSKCRKNSEKLKRDKRKIRWTEAFHITREKARARAKSEKEKKENADKEDTPKAKKKVKK
ncbi:MAG: 50S ribosomal protein L24e [Nanoarchaeota archaeon]|nr:50S ribosomal protein L24e [Nanoarchaeota archaeon]MBU1051342.1 50S ribosomal protein L24e [Nanoarchaeota archaeon]MBU1988403.1 50S ribosomal protein L24e [Nanoarchaeota archaeon]